MLLVIGYQIGHFVAEVKLVRALKKQAEIMGIDLDSELKKLETEDELAENPNILSLETEVINDIIYLYNKHTNDFICQGKTLEEVIDTAKKYNNVSLATIIHKPLKTVFLVENGLIKDKEIYNSNES